MLYIIDLCCFSVWYPCTLNFFLICGLCMQYQNSIEGKHFAFGTGSKKAKLETTRNNICSTESNNNGLVYVVAIYVFFLNLSYTEISFHSGYYFRTA